MIAALDVVEVKLGNILNADVQAPITKKVSAKLGPEFGKDMGKTAMIRVLYVV